MGRVAATKRNAKPPRPAYVLDEQIGFILRQVSQRHAMIFAREIGIAGKRVASCTVFWSASFPRSEQPSYAKSMATDDATKPFSYQIERIQQAQTTPR